MRPDQHDFDDMESRATTVAAFGQFSTVDFTMIGLGAEPRVVKAGVVDGSFFEVMGLRPVLGRLLDAQDDGPKAAGAAVLTYRFWVNSLNGDPSAVAKTIRLGPRTATVVGVLEPSVPYPADTEIIANVVTSPHHLGATMVTSRAHRMTELFGRLAPGASLEGARAELTAAHAALMREHAEAYSARAGVQLSVTTLRDQIAAPARTILLVLLAAAAVVFVIACSNVANLILARSVRREGELAVRAALGAGTGALRRTLLAESLVLCGGGAVLGLLLARPLVAIDIRAPATGAAGPNAIAFYQEATRRVAQIPGVEGATVGMFVPWRDSGEGLNLQFTAEGYTPADGEEDPRARLRLTGARFFSVVGVPLVGGREFTDEDRFGKEPVVIVNQSLAQRLFANGEALNRHLSFDMLAPTKISARIVGVVADVDDQNIVAGHPATMYLPVLQVGYGGRLFLRAAGDPPAVVPAITRVIREIAPDQPVQRAPTFDDIRAAAPSPERLNAFVFSGFAGIALLIAVVGVAGVLGFSGSARAREFGVARSR